MKNSRTNPFAYGNRYEILSKIQPKAALGAKSNKSKNSRTNPFDYGDRYEILSKIQQKAALGAKSNSSSENPIFREKATATKPAFENANINVISLNSPFNTKTHSASSYNESQSTSSSTSHSKTRKHPEPEALFNDQNKSAPPAGNKEFNLIRKIIIDTQREVISQIAELKRHFDDFKNYNEKLKNTDTCDQLNKLIERLNEESSKVTHLRLTLAFIGTMKSGKSTTINAIVGANILPNRSGAMTTMPTLVTHADGYIEPILRFPKNGPFNEALKKIKNLVNKQPKDSSGCLYQNALDRIQRGMVKEIAEEYRGQKAVYDFMEIINDISRVCKAFELGNPLAQYTHIDDFPEIKVEFSYLKDRIKENIGILSLIDTPGPNEADQGHLKAIVKDQLSKASAIVCIADPFQADSEAQDELRSWIKHARETSKIPVFVLWNKLDLLKSGDRDLNHHEAKAIKMFPNIECPEQQSVPSVSGRTFLISSEQGLYANLASKYLSIHERLPDPNTANSEDWIQTFLELSYGASWEDELNQLDNISRHLTSSDKLWNRSKMASPLENIILDGVRKAAPRCLESALKTMKEVTERTSKQIRIPLNAIDMELSELESLITRMNDRLKKIEEVKQYSERLKDRLSDDVNSTLKDQLKCLGEESKKLLDAHKEKKIKELNKKQEGFHKNANRCLWEGFSLGCEKKKPYEILLSNNDSLKFDTEGEAKGFINSAMKEIQDDLRKELSELTQGLHKPIEKAKQSLSIEMEKKIKPIIDDINKELKRDFSISLEIPKVEFHEIRMDLDIMECATVKSQEYTYTTYERRWYTLWCWKHEVKHVGTQYIVKPEEIREAVQKRIDASIQDAKRTVKEFIKNRFNNSIEQYFIVIQREVDVIQSSLNDGIRLNKSEELEKKNSKSYLTDLDQKVSRLKLRTDKLNDMIKTKILEAQNECVTAI